MLGRVTFHADVADELATREAIIWLGKEFADVMCASRSRRRLT
jgi:hypothetical protein